MWFDTGPDVPVEGQRERTEPDIKGVRAGELDAYQASPPIHAQLEMHLAQIRISGEGITYGFGCRKCRDTQDSLGGGAVRRPAVLRCVDGNDS